MAIVLDSGVLKVTEIVKKTKAKMFKDLKVGDRIVITLQVKGPGGNRGTYATYLTLTNLKTGERVFKSFNELDTILDCFEFEKEVSL